MERSFLGGWRDFVAGAVLIAIMVPLVLSSLWWWKGFAALEWGLGPSVLFAVPLVLLEYGAGALLAGLGRHGLFVIGIDRVPSYLVLGATIGIFHLLLPLPSRPGVPGESIR